MKNKEKIDLGRLQEDYKSMTRSLKYYTRRCEILETILSFEADGMKVPGGPPAQESFFNAYMTARGQPAEPACPITEFVDILIRESEDNRRAPLHGRRWSDLVISFCFLVRSLGAKAYERIRSVVTLPGKSTLQRHFGGPMHAWKEALLNTNKLHAICDLFRRLHDLDKETSIEAVLGIDAMSMEPVTSETGECPLGSNNVFLFYLMPLQCHLKSVAIHLMPRPKGNAGPDVIARAKELKMILRDKGIHVRYLATDGDSGYKGLYDEMLKQWWPCYVSRGLDGVSTQLEECECPILGDLLHLMKNARARLIGNAITICLDGSFSFTADDMNRVLKLGLSLTDKSSKGKMRDRYALEVFSLESFERLVEAKQWSMAFFVLPYALWSAAVRYSGVSTQMRREILNLVFEIFVYHMNNIDHLDHVTVSQNRTECRAQYCCSRTHCIRILNTLVSKLTELTRSPANIALGRMGTHSLECQFGTIRLLCHNKHTWKMIVRAFAKLTIIRDVGSVFGTVRPRERESIAGVKIIENGEELIYSPLPSVDVNYLYDCVQVAMMTQQGQDDDSLSLLAEEMCPVLQQVADFFIHFHLVCKTKGAVPTPMCHEGPSSNNGILARLISFRNETYPEANPETDASTEHVSAEHLSQIIPSALMGH